MPDPNKGIREGYLRLTHVLGYCKEQGLIDWMFRVGKKEARRVSTVASKIGTRVHNLIEEDWRFGKYKFKKADPIEVRNCLEAWEKFKGEHRPKIEDMEVREYNEEMKVTCQRDIRTTDTLIDIKTSSAIRSTYWVQDAVNIYCSGMAIPKMGILRLDKNLGTYEYQVKAYSEYYVDVFKGLLNWYNYMNPAMQEKE